MKILIIKTGALGDVVRTSFIAQALKNKYKREKPKITWITSESAKVFFLNNPYVDVILSEKEKSTVKKTFFDIIINLEESVELCKFSSSLKSNKKIGFIYKNKKIIPSKTAKEWFNMSLLGKKPDNDILKKQNKKSHRQIIGEIIDVDWKKYEPFVRLTKKQRLLASEFKKKNKISENELVVGLNLGSAGRWPKYLPVKKTIELIDELYKKYHCKILLFGGPDELKRNKEILKNIKSPIIDTGCENNLFEFTALISVCSLMISTDTLGLHISLALKRKTIALIGPTSPSEIDLYGLGEKIVAKSPCVCCYKKDCKSMERIEIKKIIDSVKKINSMKITVLITAFKEPKIKKAIKYALNQKTTYDYEILLSIPDKKTLEVAKKFKDKKIKFFKDPGKGKSYALNLIFKTIKTDILVLTDGDVFLSENSVEDIVSKFKDPEIGCVSGRPIPEEDKKSKYGYWANFLFDSAHEIRQDAASKDKFIECSGYLFAFRKKKISSIPLDVAEDTYIPYVFWEKGYKIGYADNAKVYVKNPDNWNDWILQKSRTSKAHETLEKYTDTFNTPRVKNFKNESKGIVKIFSYPKKFKEIFWTLELIFARLFMWLKVFYETKFKRENYADGWERIESTK